MDPETMGSWTSYVQEHKSEECECCDRRLDGLMPHTWRKTGETETRQGTFAQFEKSWVKVLDSFVAVED